MTRRPSQELPKKVGGWDGRKGGKSGGKVFTPKQGTDSYMDRLIKSKKSEAAASSEKEKDQQDEKPES